MSADNNNNNNSANSQEDLHIVTENGEQSIMWRSNQLTYIGQDRHELPGILASKFGHLATRLDLSYNSLTSFKSINLFTNLNELILDNNELKDDQLDFRLNLRLKTLSMNKNKLTDLFKLVNAIKVCYPNIEFLSLIGNPLCPGPICCGSATAAATTTTTNQSYYGQESGRVECADTATTIVNGEIQVIDELSAVDSSGHSRDCSDMGANLYANRPSSTSDYSQQKYRHFVIYHLPNLRFLDSNPVSGQEREEALRRCFWMNRTTKRTTTTTTTTSSNGSNIQVGIDATSSDYGLGLASLAEEQGFQLSIMTLDRQQAEDTNQHQQAKGVFSRLAYKYTGRNSEGNRFIRNHDL